MSIVIKGKKGAGTITVETGSASIGTRSSCTLSLEDPLLAEKHAVLHQDAGSFFVEDLGSSSGTYLNGVAISGRVAIAAEGESSLVLGVSRILLSVDAAKNTLTATVKEASFFYDKKEDPLEWSRAEVRFGRFRPVALGNMAAVTAVFALFAVSFVDPVADPLLEPGPLASVHAHAMAEKGSDGCASCHQPLRGTPPSKCATCHEDIVKGTVHPPDFENHSCQPCHLDHQGVDKAHLTSVTAEQTCGQCHDADRVPSKPLRERPIEAKWVTRTYDTFPHDVHLRPELALQGIEGCQTCHLRLPLGSEVPADAARGQSRREHQVIDYERCMGCHESGGSAKTEWKLAWHGTDQGAENCLKCHQTLHAKELRMVARDIPLNEAGLPKPWLAYALAPRSHVAEATAHARDNPQGCIQCHRDGVERSDQRMIGRSFLHGLHLTPERKDSECRECHVEQTLNTTLSLDRPHYQGTKIGCTTCHREEVPIPSASGVPTSQVQVVEFPHARHLDLLKTSLTKGCQTCHLVAPDVRDSVPPTTLADARSCLPCHGTHNDIAGGHCDNCHLPGDGVYSNSKLPRVYPAPNAFRHASRGHTSVDCKVCHIGTEFAHTLSATPIPVETDASCRDCHILQKARFHWK